MHCFKVHDLKYWPWTSWSRKWEEKYQEEEKGWRRRVRRRGGCSRRFSDVLRFGANTVAVVCSAAGGTKCKEWFSVCHNIHKTRWSSWLPPPHLQSPLSVTTNLALSCDVAAKLLKENPVGEEQCAGDPHSLIFRDSDPGALEGHHTLSCR